MILSHKTDINSVKNTVYGAAHSYNHSIFDPGGYELFEKNFPNDVFNPVYGSYAQVSKTGDSVRVSTDHFGTFRIFQYRNGSKWAISNSIAELVSFAKANRLPLTPYTPAAYSFFIGEGVGQQLSSFRTPISEIELIPHWNDIIIKDRNIFLVQRGAIEWSEDLHEGIYIAGRFFTSLLHSYVN